jgi:hypothetical protein
MRKTLWTVGIVIVALASFIIWYRAHYSMGVAEAFAVNDSSLQPRVLIATQKSEFKGAVVGEIVEHFKSWPAYVKVIDVSALDQIDESQWTAIAVVHTWEMRKPPAAVGAFVQRVRDPHKVIALTTSGRGDFKLEGGVDVISSASVMLDAPARAAQMNQKLDAIIGHTNKVAFE